jgi:hypothetical protein
VDARKRRENRRWRGVVEIGSMVEIARQSHNWGYALWQQEIKNKGDLILFLFFKKMYQREAAQAVRRGKGGVGVG